MDAYSHRYWDTFVSSHIRDAEFNSDNLLNKHDKP